MSRPFEGIYSALAGEAKEETIAYAIQILKGRKTNVSPQKVRLLISDPSFLTPVKPQALPAPPVRMPIPAVVEAVQPSKPDPGIMKRVAQIMKKGKAWHEENKDWIERCEADFSRC